MDKEQELEWLEAQKIVISEDLLDVAKKQLKFLATVERHRCLYDDGPILHRAIYRYKTYWLPLLAKHAGSEISEGPLVVPLDCEWVWHCHRLNPVRYKADCEEFFGRTLDNWNVVSKVHGACGKQTEEIWNRLYPAEPYELDLSSPFTENTSEKVLEALESTKYDLVSAIKRQSPFFYQVSRPSMNDDLFLEVALTRYKGFLYLIKRNTERSIKQFTVPTYDIDLMWHSHQLHPISYCKDLVEIMGKVLQHDDMDSNRSKGQKLDVGFSGTTKQWEETFGSRYWRAGAMYRGTAPSPLTVIPWSSNVMNKNAVLLSDSQKTIDLPKINAVEVLLEIVAIKNVPDGHKGSLFVLFSKKKADALFNVRRRLSILSVSKEKQVASFQCEPTGELLFELQSQSPSSLPISKRAKTIGTTSISLQELLDPVSKMSVEKWFQLVPSSGSLDFQPICLRIAVSITNPVPSPHVLHMVRSRPFSRSSCFFPLPGQHAKTWTCVVDEAGNEIVNIQMRDVKKANGKRDCISKKEVIGIIGCSGETHVLAQFLGTGWTLMDSTYSFQPQNKSNEDGHAIELSADRMVKIYPGRVLEYEQKSCDKHKNESDFMTVVNFSAEDPYGKALALFNLKSGLLKVKEETFVLPGITLAFILSDILKKEGHNGFASNVKQLVSEDVDGFNVEGTGSVDTVLGKETGTKEVAEEGSIVMPEKAEGELFSEDGLGDSGYENVVKSGVCDGRETNCIDVVSSGGCGGCGGGCGNMVTSGGCGGCGSGCGGGCGNMVTSGGCGGCGSGCGGGCGNMIKSGGCGGCGGSGGCGGGCGNMAKSSGCGGAGGCGGGCGNNVARGKHDDGVSSVVEGQAI